MRATCDFQESRSWVKPGTQSPQLLQHEQGHYYLGSLCALRFLKRIAETTFTRTDYQAKISQIWTQTYNELIAEEINYDIETDHYFNWEQQVIWSQRLENEINSLQSYWNRGTFK